MKIVNSVFAVALMFNSQISSAIDCEHWNDDRYLSNMADECQKLPDKELLYLLNSKGYKAYNDGDVEASEVLGYETMRIAVDAKKKAIEKWTVD